MGEKTGKILSKAISENLIPKKAISEAVTLYNTKNYNRLMGKSDKRKR
jgi:hypothetical protein